MWIATIWNQEKLGGGIWILLHSTQLERRDELDGVYYSVRRRRSPHESRGNTYDRLDAHSGHLSPRSGSRSSARGPSGLDWLGFCNAAILLPSALAAPQRKSMRKLRPTVHPNSCSPCNNAALRT